ncbi:MAG: HD family hydrolase [Myxococcota bacterium]
MTARAQHILDTLIGLDPLSSLHRTGWALRGVASPESIADHSHGVALCTMLIVDALRAEGQSVDGEKALRMAIVHDAPEAATGDVPMPVKTPELDAALAAVESTLVDRLLPSGVAADWREMEAGESLEARIVKAADKLQMMAKADIYGSQGRGQLEDFWANEMNFRNRGLAVVEEVFSLLRERHRERSRAPRAGH